MKMKAAIRRQYCLPDEIQIEEIDKPQAKSHQVLVKVLATTVNRTDCANLTAKPFIMRFVCGLLKPKNMILGTDFAGIVEEVGQSVRQFKIGDRVFGFNDVGCSSQAEHLVVSSDAVYLIPDEVDYLSAAASLEGAHYAYSTLSKLNFEFGQEILINGATGAIGSAFLQFSRLHDLRITVTADTKNMELMKSLGADKVIDYTKEDFTTTTEQYDYIMDAVGKSTFGQCKRLLKKNGVYVSSELGPFAQNLFYPLITLFRNKKVRFPIPIKIKESILFLRDRLESGDFKPVIDKQYPLEEISHAYTYVNAGLKTGNVLINFGEND